LALGRLTNLALAISIEPRLAESIAEVVVMGGAVLVPGNVSPVASANLYEDPEAAAIVYASGASLAQVGLDVCNLVTISELQLERIAEADTPSARLLCGATKFLQRSYVSRGLLPESGGVRYNDMPAVAYAIAPELFVHNDYFVEIETLSPVTRGQTVAHQPAPGGHRANAKVCVEIDAQRLSEMFTRRVAGLGRD
jgi:inosine-uridine nucleoside N-ribohydrolase